MSKQELADALFELIPDVYELETTLIISDAEEWNLFNKLLKAPYVQEETLTPRMYLFLMNRGLLFSFYYEDKLIYSIPEEIKDSYRQLSQQSFHEARDRCQLINQYISASANLYGICTLDKTIEIFNAQNEKQVDENELISFLNLASGRGQEWYLNQGYIISNYFDSEDQDEELKALLERAKHKPYYIPPQPEFLKYADSGYFEETPQLVSLRAFILKHLCKDKEFVENLVDDIQVACSMEEPLSVIMGEFERRDIIFDNNAQVQAIMPLIIDVYNHTRIWSNRGHTPAELGGGAGQTARPISNKVGRNDPCPCGSGKKYKKCCGK
ncbi:YecA family protein [Cohnella faecalis]|nr:SEC-C metal-binding domain-containing protein [Cohnella faecalis]